MATENTDLNKLRELLQKSRAQGTNLPSRADEKIFVDNQGDIVRGGSSGAAGNRPLSEVQQGTFASPARYAQDAATVRDKLPRNAQPITANGTQGWLYSFNNAFGHPFTMFVYYSATNNVYAVKVVEPEVENKYNPHYGHLYGDGRICFAPGAYGLPRLEDAYAKSVLWAAGFTTLDKTGAFLL